MLQSVDKIGAECFEEYRNDISTLHEKFVRRFPDFDTIEREFKPFSTPFTVNVNYVSKELQTELLNLMCDSLPKEKYVKIDFLEFSKFLLHEKYYLLFDSSFRILAMLGSTYVCEQCFLLIKINKFSLRSILADEHLQSIVRLVNGKGFKPSFDNLVA